MWILFAILHVGQLLAHAKAVFAQRHVRYLLAQRLVLWNLLWDLRRNLWWQWLPQTSVPATPPVAGSGKGLSELIYFPVY